MPPSLETLNTLALPADAAGVEIFERPGDLERRLRSGGGFELAGELSNPVLAERVPRPLLLFRDGALLAIERRGDGVHVEVEGSCPLDALVAALCAEGIAGLELLSGIPGTVGAAVVQNVAAYGQQFSAALLSVEAWSFERSAPVMLAREDLGFAYRTSVLKGAPGFTPPAIVLRAALRLSGGEPEPIRYRDVSDHIAAARLDPSDVAARREAVLAVRQRKGMVVGGSNWVPSAGSFFLSPVVPRDTALAIARQVRGEGFADNFLTWYNPDSDFTRLPAALVLRAAGFMNGDRWGPVGLSPHHILALRTFPGATGSDVLALSRLLAASVRERFGVGLEPEVRLLGTLARPADDLAARHPRLPGTAEPEWATSLGRPAAS